MATLSIVIPAFNEADNIPELWHQLSDVRGRIDMDVEVIFVNDGSTDSTLRVLREIRSQGGHIKIVDLSRNFGHQQAVTAGLHQANGDAVILMDADLQDRPETIPDFIREWRNGSDVVYAVRVNRKESRSKRTAFRLFYRLQSLVTSISVPLDAGLFSLLDKRVVRALLSMGEYNRYIPGMRAYVGFKQTGVAVEREARHSGQPRVSIAGLVNLALNGIFAFSTLPLRMATLLGFLVAALSTGFGIYALVARYLFGVHVLGWQFGLTTLLLLVGLLFLSIGILGEYVGRIYDEVKHRPVYVIKERIGFD